MIAMQETLLTVDNLSKTFGSGGETLWAVRDVSLSVKRGECVAIVGESGSGKTTLARLMLGLTSPSAGRIGFGDEDVHQLAASRSGRRRLAQRLQMVFQDPHSSLDPSMRVADIVSEPLRIFGWKAGDIATRVAEVLELVGLSPDHGQRRPHELSGGQRQRVGIARALGPRPEILLLDEPVASLDVSIQGQILQLLKDIQAATGIAVVIIAHDLGVVRAIADRTLVMYLGRVVEAGPTTDLFAAPIHPYASALLRSASAEGRQTMDEAMRTALAREPLPSSERNQGCVFRSRCWRRIERCDTRTDRVERGPGHMAWCNAPLGEPAGDRT